MMFKEKFQKFNREFGRKTVEEKDFVFDQNSFDIQLYGGKSQAELIKIQATLKVGDYKGKKIQLQCKWYNKTNNDIKEIPGILYQSYQPCLLDVGTTIHIQCIPIFPGKQYEGMPIIKQIGPLAIDKQTQQQANDFIQSKKATFFIKILSKKIKNQQDFSQPVEGLLKMSQSYLLIQQKVTNNDSYVMIYSLEISELFPNYKFHRIEVKQFKIQLSPQEFIIVSVQQHRIRDLISLTTKMLLAKKIMKSNEKKEDPSVKKNSAKDMLQLSQLSKFSKQLQIKVIQTEKKYNQQRQQKEDLQMKLKELEQRQNNFSKNYYVIQEELKKLKEQKIKNSDHENYILNEIKMLRQENENSKSVIENYKLQLNYYISKVKNYEILFEEKTYEDLKKQYTQIYDQNIVLNSKINYYFNQNEKLNQQIKNQQKKIEELQNQTTYLLKKYDILIQEKMLNFNQINQFKDKKLEEKDKLRQKEMIKLQQQIKKLIQENNQLQLASKNNKNPKIIESPPKKAKKAQVIQLQKLANRLAETITQKQLANVQMREVNKQLIEKIHGLEKKIFEIQKSQSLKSPNNN